MNIEMDGGGASIAQCCVLLILKSRVYAAWPKPITLQLLKIGISGCARAGHALQIQT
jgi:hypothetical protein